MDLMGRLSKPILVAAALHTPAAALAACPTPTTSVDVIEEAEASAEAYKNADLVGFVKHTTQLEAAIPCLAEPLERNVAAQVHRMMGLRAFVDQKSEKSQEAFGAARGIEPAYRFPETMVPPGHPIMDAYEAMAADEIAVRKDVPTAAGGYFQFDGRSSTERPVNVPTVAQLFNGDGGIETSGYLWPDAGMFDYEQGDPARPAGSEPVLVDTRPKGPNVPLAASAGGAAVLSGVAYAIAASSAAKYNSPETPYADGPGLVSRNHTFTVVSGGAGVAAVGLGVGAVLAGRW